MTASTENIENGKTTFRDVLQQSVLLRTKEQIENHPETRTADGYKTHQELLSKCLKSNGRQTVYTACMIGQCLYELKKIYEGNKKIFICATKHLVSISYVYFFIDLFNFATTYHRISCISLPLAVVHGNVKLVK